VPISWLGYPNRLAFEPSQDLLQSNRHRHWARQQAGVGTDSEKCQQAVPRETYTAHVIECIVEPSPCSFVLAKRFIMRVDQEICVNKDHL